MAGVSKKRDREQNRSRKGFTLIELLVVIAIIGVLSSVAMTSLNGARKKARDTKRLSDMEQIINALEIYKSVHGTYPANTDSTALPNPLSDNNGGWDLGYFGGESGGDTFIQPLVTDAIMSKVSGDSVGTTSGDTYAYYRYGAGSSNCDVNRGAFFVLGVRNMETSGSPHPKSPGWSCPLRNWQGEFEWVTGGFEN